MKALKKIGKVLLIIILVIAIALTVGLNIKTVLSAHKNKDVIAAATPVADLTIPEGVQIVGLGEATHGSVQFQESKLEVFKLLVEKYDYRAIAIEADFSECLAANAYIQGGDGDACDIVNNLSFNIYHTQQMADLLSWMREYNATAPADKRLRFYGFDMQNWEKGVEPLKAFIASHNFEGCSTQAMEAMADPDRTESLSEAEVEAISQELQQIGTALNQCDQADPDVINMKKVVENMETAREYYQLEFPDSYTYRDTAMAANVTWILNREKELGSGKLLIAGHDGHIAKCTSSAIIPVVMGGVLKEQYGDAYYSLGTDTFKGKANIHVETSAEYTRKDYFFHSADPMAYQAKYMEDKHYFLDFTTLSESHHPEVYEQVHSKMNMASLGEGFSAIYYLLPYVYRINMTPTDLYDGMIFYYEVQATNPEY